MCTLAVNVTTPVRLTVKLAVNTLAITSVSLNGVAVEYEAVAGFGRTVVRVTSAGAVSSVSVTVTFTAADDASVKVTAGSSVSMPTNWSRTPMVTGNPEVAVAARPGGTFTVAAPLGFDFTGATDPQSATSSLWRLLSSITTMVRPHLLRHFMLVTYMVSQSSVEVVQIMQIKVDATAQATEPAPKRGEPPPAPNASSWMMVDLLRNFNANISQIYHPDGSYLSLWPKTCSARIGTDGYSAWTFTYGQGNPPPFLSLNNATAYQVPGSCGVLMALGGARFDGKALLTRGTSGRNITFMSQWDNYPVSTTINISVALNETLWVLVTGSTNPMQTLLPNTALRTTHTDDGTTELELILPVNFWSLSAYGRVYYDYDPDGFCLPLTLPKMMVLGKDCKAMVYSMKNAGGSEVKSLTLETLSLKVVMGLMAVGVQTLAP